MDGFFIVAKKRSFLLSRASPSLAIMRSRHIACVLALVCVLAPILVAAVSENAGEKQEDLLGEFWRALDLNANKEVSSMELYTFFTKIYTHPAKTEDVRGRNLVFKNPLQLQPFSNVPLLPVSLVCL